MPPIIIDWPVLTENLVFSCLVEITGELIPDKTFSVALLTCWSTSREIKPSEPMRGVTWRMTPVSRYWIERVKVCPLELEGTISALMIGTWSPTLIVAEELFSTRTWGEERIETSVSLAKALNSPRKSPLIILPVEPSRVAGSTKFAKFVLPRKEELFFKAHSRPYSSRSFNVISATITSIKTWLGTLSRLSSSFTIRKDSEGCFVRIKITLRLSSGTSGEKVAAATSETGETAGTAAAGWPVSTFGAETAALAFGSSLAR